MAKIYHFNRLFPKNHFKEGDEEMIQNMIAAIKNKEDLDIRKMALINYTSTSSITRLVKRAGFNNFKEFIFFLSNEWVNNESNTLDSLPFAKLNQEWQIADQYFIQAFSKKKIYLFGEGFCQLLVNYTYRKLLLKKIYAIDLDGTQISLVSDQTPHTLMIFSQSGENQNGLIKMNECKSYGGHVIAFTATDDSSFITNSDLSFIVESGNVNADYENQHLNYFFGNSLNLIEYLIHKYTKE